MMLLISGRFFIHFLKMPHCSTPSWPTVLFAIRKKEL